MSPRRLLPEQEEALGLPIFQVDAFTSQPFRGNPAAVCPLPSPRPDAWMQSVAREMNLSETAFPLAGADGYGLRWFTPKVEVDLCGHATLASAHILWETGALKPTEAARFHTRSGPLSARRDGDWIELDFPADPPAPAVAPPELVKALGVRPVEVRKGRYYLVEVASEEAVKSVAPDFALLANDAFGVMVTSRASSPGADFVSRFFAPAHGINEDPVTGSSHCCLTPYWQEKLGKREMVARQVSERGGMLRVRASGGRVYIAGQAVTVLRGELVD